MAMAVIGEMAAAVLVVLGVLAVYLVVLVAEAETEFAVVKRERVGGHDISPLVDLPRLFQKVVGVCVAVDYNLRPCLVCEDL